MTELRLYDTASREKRVFTPREADRITMYVCGPTVYARAHIGNARPAVVFDVLARLLRYLYPERILVHAANITDIEDKIIAAAAAENVPMHVVTTRYSRFYFDDLAALGVPRPDLVPLATDHIEAMKAMIARLIAAGYAYAADGHVLFDVPSWPDYGRLSGRSMDEMIAGARVDVAPYKRSPADFVLWKPSDPSQPGWDSIWGIGRPGWHIECSAMIAAHLGETIDIHGGGLDLEFPHHENEIAQSSCAHGGAALARYWLHNGMLSMGDGKMSKSSGNVATVSELLADGHDGLHLRFALLSANYRQPLEWSDRVVAQAQRTLDNLRNGYKHWCNNLRALPMPEARPHPDFVAALCDDLNTPEAFAVVARLVKAGDWSSAIGSLALVGVDEYLTMAKKAPNTFGGKSLDDWIATRTVAKKNRDFGEADRIRAFLDGYGVTLKDKSDGSTDFDLR